VVASLQKFILSLSQRLGRVTTGAAVIPEIDGLRFLAIFPVVLQHFSERLLRLSEPVTKLETGMAKALSNGHIGVYLFFAISGFILALPFGRKSSLTDNKLSLKKYYLRRLTRLEPPYLISMGGLFAVLIVFHHQDFSALLPHFLASIFYVHRLIYDTWSPINPPAWTLEIEVQFYLIAPFLAIGYFYLPVKWRRGMLVALIIGKIILTNTTSLFSSLTLTLAFLFEFFLVGLLIADIVLASWKSDAPKHKFFDFVALISLVVMFSTWTWHENLIWKFIFIIALFFTFYGSLRSVHFNKFLRSPWITGLGGMCYSLYLLHLGLIEFFMMIYKNVLPSHHYWINYVVGILLFLPLLLLICIPFFLLIEKPCMNPSWPTQFVKWIRSIVIRPA
jgi:peptidoglycan/LPS O-acetylase OafA/YrhL